MTDLLPAPLTVEELADIVERDPSSSLSRDALQELVERASAGNCTYTLAQVREMGWLPPGLVGLSKEDACQVLGWGDFRQCSGGQQQAFALLAGRIGLSHLGEPSASVEVDPRA